MTVLAVFLLVAIVGLLLVYDLRGRRRRATTARSPERATIRCGPCGRDLVLRDGVLVCPACGHVYVWSAAGPLTMTDTREGGIDIKAPDGSGTASR